ncbi:MAG: hypothetical protein K2O13_09250 [Lachnospiraceae bacterium]|nr:hypothetical protein [Lachnospiraceae bacterium]
MGNFTHPFTERKPEFLLPHAIARLDGKVEYPTSVPYRDTEHKADKAAAVEVIGTIMGGMVKQSGDILKHSAEF